MSFAGLEMDQTCTGFTPSVCESRKHRLHTRRSVLGRWERPERPRRGECERVEADSECEAL